MTESTRATTACGSTTRPRAGARPPRPAARSRRPSASGGRSLRPVVTPVPHPGRPPVGVGGDEAAHVAPPARKARRCARRRAGEERRIRAYPFAPPSVSATRRPRWSSACERGSTGPSSRWRSLRAAPGQPQTGPAAHRRRRHHGGLASWASTPTPARSSRARTVPHRARGVNPPLLLPQPSSPRPGWAISPRGRRPRSGNDGTGALDLTASTVSAIANLGHTEMATPLGSHWWASTEARISDLPPSLELLGRCRDRPRRPGPGGRPRLAVRPGTGLARWSAVQRGTRSWCGTGAGGGPVVSTLHALPATGPDGRPHRPGGRLARAGRRGPHAHRPRVRRRRARGRDRLPARAAPPPGRGRDHGRPRADVRWYAGRSPRPR